TAATPRGDVLDAATEEPKTEPRKEQGRDSALHGPTAATPRGDGLQAPEAKTEPRKERGRNSAPHGPTAATPRGDGLQAPQAAWRWASISAANPSRMPPRATS